jgi:hypothetical protein
MAFPEMIPRDLSSPVRALSDNRVQTEFAANGIWFARREVRVALPDKKTEADLSEEEMAALASAAIAT